MLSHVLSGASWFLIYCVYNLKMQSQSYCVFFQESYTYKDPITEFVECLYVNFDFDSAQKKLRECESVSSVFSNDLLFRNTAISHRVF